MTAHINSQGTQPRSHAGLARYTGQVTLFTLPFPLCSRMERRVYL